MNEDAHAQSAPSRSPSPALPVPVRTRARHLPPPPAPARCGRSRGRAAHEQCERRPEAQGGGSAMYRQGRAAAAAAAAARLRAWPRPERPAHEQLPPRRRYRARPQDLAPPGGHVPALQPPPPPLSLSPPEGLGGAFTTVDGRSEDDIAVRDGPGASALLLLRGSNGTAPRAPRQPPSMEEHLAVMHQKLQHELPNFFLKIPDYGLYSHDVEFINHLLHLHTRGRPMYQVAVALCRALAWGYFASLRLEVLALTRHPEDWSIRARWRLTGLPLHLCMLRFYRRDKATLLRSYDAFSTFFLNSQGLIRCHRVDKLMPAPTPLAQDKKLLVAAAVAALSAPVPPPVPPLHLAMKPSSATPGDP
ncbi:uncharacterized protein C6orf136 homolog [Neopsephotus bourkii]|uniref:uncharacterized protein C6orf136 homolog n=1 Tax=Neopsephotus bourkii TaxID=309878 RepID=UPI002AA5C6AF|nr:uncharacterized protein C6orf136 homolog [Neopsephotus bourkii]